MNNDNDDPRAGSLDLAWMIEKGAKTRAAINDLLGLLVSIGEDGKVDDAEISELVAWKIAHRHVLTRASIRPFAEWLDRILADGSVSSEERLDLLGWCHWAKVNLPKFQLAADSASASVFSPMPVPSSSRGSSWRSDPASARQLTFLEDLGADPTTFDGLTKGAASAMIDRLLAQRDDEAAKEFAEKCRAHLNVVKHEMGIIDENDPNTLSSSLTFEDVVENLGIKNIKPPAVAPKRSPEPAHPKFIEPRDKSRHSDPKAVYMEMMAREDGGNLVKTLLAVIAGAVVIFAILLLVERPSKTTAVEQVQR